MADIVWSPIHTANDKGEFKVISTGESVSAGDVGGKDALDELKAAGAVRNVDYPETGPYESPREFNLRKLNEALAEAEANAYADLDFNISAPEEPVAPAEEVVSEKTSATSKS